MDPWACEGGEGRRHRLDVPYLPDFSLISGGGGGFLPHENLVTLQPQGKTTRSIMVET